jgi:SAM-dependent methyltransferase
MAPEQRLSLEAERAHYATHENDPNDARYRAFLEQLATPLAERVPRGAAGLDFGSGPGPTLSLLFEERGHVVDLYDPFFAPAAHVLTKTYDFITCTEVAEHFRAPGREFARLDGLLRPGGWFGLMTELVPEERAFHQWYYPRDPTHVVFYRRRTLAWLEQRLGWSLRYEDAKRVFLFQKGLAFPSEP